jgi:hypothetical protein
MSKRKQYWVILPNGQPMPATKSKTTQEAVAKAMMMDVPAGCRVEEVKKVETAQS